MDQTVASSSSDATKEELLHKISKLIEENKTLCAIVETANQNLRHLKSAVESFSGGFALFDKHDKLVHCNETYRRTQPELADVFKPGNSFEDIVRARIKRKLFDPAIVRDEAWIQNRLYLHKNPSGPIERKIQNNEYVEIREFKTTEGGIAVFRSDITPRKLSEVAMRQSEERFRTLCDGSKQGILVHRNHKILYVNQTLADMYGYETVDDVLLIKNSLALLPKSRHKNASERHHGLLIGGNVAEDAEQIHLKKNGTRFWVENRAFLIDWDGEKAVCSTRFDITGRKAAIEAAFAAEQRFRHLFDRSLQGILIHRNLKALYVNKAIADMYGYEGPREVMNLPSTVLLMPEDFREKSSIAHFERLNGELGASDEVIRGLKKDGSIIWISIRSFAIDWDGAPAVCSIRSDITERRLAEQELLKSEMRFKALAESSIQGIVVHRDLKPLYANPAFAKMHGYDTAEQILSIPNLLALVAPKMRERVPAILAKLRDGNPSGHGVEIECIRQDGSKFWTSNRYFEIEWDGTPATCVTRIDLTEQKRTESLLKDAMESIPDGFALYDSDDRLALFNENYAKKFPAIRDAPTLGITFEEQARNREKSGIRGQYLNKRVSLEERIKLHKQGGHHFESTMPDGTTLLSTEFKTSNGGTAIIRTDITDLKRATEELNNSEIRFRELAEGSVQGILVHRNHKPLYANDAFAKTYGFNSSKEILALKSTLDLLTPFLHDEAAKRHCEVLERQKSFENTEIQGIRKDGSIIWTKSHIFPINWDGETASCVTRYDITEEKRTELALDYLPVGIILVDENAKIKHINRLAREIAKREDGLFIHNGIVSADNADERTQLHTLIHEVISNVRSSGTSDGIAITLTRSSGASAYPMTIGTIAEDNSAPKTTDNVNPIAAIFITDPDRPQNFSSEMLERLFSLTPSEARLLKHLVAGLSIKDAAREMNNAPDTARHHLKSIFQKTGAHRQAELIKLVMSTPLWTHSP